jgi:hypothetical protein
MDEQPIYRGVAVGGPYEGRVIEGRRPQGILFVDRPSATCIIYDWVAAEGKFYARTNLPVPMNSSRGQSDNRVRAALENEYEVRARIEEVPSWLP